ncbi:MAG: hypothetical protein AAB870_00940, partial [Patescibacteria group bacterium]
MAKSRSYLKLPNATGNIFEVEIGTQYFTESNFVVYDRSKEFGTQRSPNQLPFLHKLDLTTLKDEWSERLEQTESTLFLAGQSEHEYKMAEKGKNAFLTPLMRINEVFEHLEFKDTNSALRVLSEIGYDLMGSIQQAVQDSVEVQGAHARYEAVSQSHVTLNEDIPKWIESIYRVSQLSKEFQGWKDVFITTKKQAEADFEKASKFVSPDVNDDIKYAYEYFDGNEQTISFCVRANDALHADKKDMALIAQLCSEGSYYMEMINESEEKARCLWEAKRDDYDAQISEIGNEFEKVWGTYEAAISKIIHYINMYKIERLPLDLDKHGFECEKEIFEKAMSIVKNVSAIKDEKYYMNDLSLTTHSYLAKNVQIPDDLASCLSESKSYIDQLKNVGDSKQTPHSAPMTSTRPTATKKEDTTPKTPVKTTIPITTVQKTEVKQTNKIKSAKPVVYERPVENQRDKDRLEELYEIVLCIGYDLTCNRNLTKKTSIGSFLRNVPSLGLCTNAEVELYLKSM